MSRIQFLARKTNGDNNNKKEVNLLYMFTFMQSLTPFSQTILDRGNSMQRRCFMSNLISQGFLYYGDVQVCFFPRT